MTTPTPIQLETAKRLLGAMHNPSGEGVSHSFMFGRPGSNLHDRRLGTAIFYPRREMIRVAQYVRENGPAYLKYLDLGDVRGLLTEFIADNFYILAGECWPARFQGTYAGNVSEAVVLAWADALAASPIFSPKTVTTLFPLMPIQVSASFDTDSFFLCAPSELPKYFGGEEAKSWLLPTVFPPFKEANRLTQTPSAWLGVRAPTTEVAKKIKAAVLGAMALTPEPRHRHTFSGRKMFGGWCIVDGRSLTEGGGSPHTPPMMTDIQLGSEDHAWLGELARMLASPTRADRRKLFALEYFYRAWPLGKAARFPIFCMALDGVFGDANQATQAVVTGVRETLGEGLEAARLRDLMSLRASVIHGGAPDVYDFSKYARYYKDYEADPVFDLELVVGECLRARIFGDRMGPYKDPHAEMIADLQARGRLPRDLYEDAILRPGERGAAANGSLAD